MQLIRRFGQREHYHLERHNHGEYTQEVNRLAQKGIHSRDIPRRHGGTEQNQKGGEQRNLHTVEHTLHKGIVTEGHTLDKIVEPGAHFPGGKRKRVGLYKRILLKRVHHYCQHRKYIDNADHGQYYGKNGFCILFHYCCTSFLRV